MNQPDPKIEITKTIPQDLDQTRLDLALSKLLPEYSRARIQTWIKTGWVTIDGEVFRPKDKVRTDQTVKISATSENLNSSKPQPIALTAIYEDEDIIVINKPAGLVTHPGAGNIDGTLLNALLYHYPELAKLPRAGIIHRLDKDTSGLMVVTRNLLAHNKLTQDLQNREIKREYEAIVHGNMISGGTIEANIGRHPVKRTHMAVKETGKPAITHYRIIKHFLSYTHIRVMLETGRTHQIRVHLAHIGYPIVGDPIYNKITNISEKLNPILRERLKLFKRQALHSRHLELTHPRTNKLMSWQAPLPKDMTELLKALKKYNSDLFTA